MTTRDRSTIQSWSIEYLSKTLDVPTSKIRPDVDIDRLGLDSTGAVAFMMSLEEWVGIELTPELLFEHPTIAKLSDHIAGRAAAAE
jgi:acyl carrier protein